MTPSQVDAAVARRISLSFAGPPADPWREHAGRVEALRRDQSARLMAATASRDGMCPLCRGVVLLAGGGE